MEVSIDKKNNSELYININIKKDDYKEEFKNTFHQYKNNINAKGFRGRNINIDVLFRDFGKKIFSNIINNKISEEFKKIESENKSNNLLLNSPILIETTYKDKEITSYDDFNKIEEIELKYISYTNEILKADDIYKKLKPLNIENLSCQEIDLNSMFASCNKLLFSYYIIKENTKAKENNIVLLTDTNNEELVLSVNNSYIDNIPIDILNKELNDKININISNVNNINTNDEILDYINRHNTITPGEKEYKVTKIFSKNTNLKIEDIINNLENLIKIKDEFVNKQWLSDFLNIDILDKEIKDENSILKNKDYNIIIKAVIYICNYVLNKINIFNIKNSILDVFDINVPEIYIDNKLNSLGIENIKTNEEINKNLREIIKNEIVLNNIAEMILIDKNIDITEEDIKNYIEVDNTLRDNNFDSILSNYYNKASKHKFITTKNTYREYAIESKIIYEIKNSLNIQNKKINYKEFLELTHV